MKTASWAGGLSTACLLALVACGGGAEPGSDDRGPAIATGSAAVAAPSSSPGVDSTTPKPTPACASDVDCDDHDPCTIDRCTSRREGEFVKRACEHVASPSCGSDAGAPAVDAAPPPPPSNQPSCSPLAGTLSTMKTTQSGNAAEAFHNVWCCIGRLNECAFPVGTCIAGQVTQTQALAGAECAAVGSHGTCQDDDATWTVRCDATVLCRIGCDGTCVPETCH